MILSRIIEEKRRVIEEARRAMSQEELVKSVKNICVKSSFRKNVSRPHHINLIAEIKKAFAEADVPVSFVAAATGEGVGELMAKAMKLLDRMAARSEAKEEALEKVFRPQPRDSGNRVHKEGNIFIIESPHLERIVSRVEMTNPEVRGQFRQQLDKRGITRALQRAGVKPGNKVRCGDFEWEW